MNELLINGISLAELEKALEVRQKVCEALLDKVQSQNKEEKDAGIHFLLPLVINDIICKPAMSACASILANEKEAKVKGEQGETAGGRNTSIFRILVSDTIRSCSSIGQSKYPANN